MQHISCLGFILYLQMILYRSFSFLSLYYLGGTISFYFYFWGTDGWLRKKNKNMKEEKLKTHNGVVKQASVEPLICMFSLWKDWLGFQQREEPSRSSTYGKVNCHNIVFFLIVAVLTLYCSCCEVFSSRSMGCRHMSDVLLGQQISSILSTFFVEITSLIKQEAFGQIFEHICIPTICSSSFWRSPGVNTTME